MNPSTVIGLPLLAVLLLVGGCATSDQPPITDASMEKG
jgi:hypothetical protein